MKKRKELNNKGFSLVELMIATVILAIVVAPLLHTFVTAASTTARSRQMGDATLAGENIAEKVEASSFNDILSGRVFPGATVNTTADGCHTVTIPSEQVGSSVLSAEITLNPVAYRKGTGETVDRLNDILMADYANMDAVFVQSLGPDNPDVLSRIEFENDADTHEDYRGWVEDTVETFRTMTIKVKKTGDMISVNLDLYYEYVFEYLKEDPNTGIPIQHNGRLTNSVPYTLLDNYSLSENNGNPPNIYVIYYPIYGGAATINDTIEIKNEIGQSFNLFLVKARLDELEESDPDVFEKYPQYEDYESDDINYDAQVKQYVDDDADDSEFAVIYSNIAEYLYTSASEPGGELPGIDYRIYRGPYFSSRGSFAGENGDLVSKSAQDRIFEVTVDIYAAGGATPIHTVRSTKLK